jgi:hypothetical protein
VLPDLSLYVIPEKCTIKEIHFLEILIGPTPQTAPSARERRNSLIELFVNLFIAHIKL